MITKLFISAVCMMTITSCTGQKNVSTEKTANSNNELKITPPENFSSMSTEKGEINFEEGENKFLREYDMNVTFNKITEDSRCPKGVECVWKGAATAEIEFMGTYTRPVKVLLSTVNNAERNLTKEAIFNGYKISLVQVNPYPTSNKKESSTFDKKKITLQFVKISENQIEQNVR